MSSLSSTTAGPLSSCRPAGLLVIPVALAACCCLQPARACSLAEDFMFATHADQWLAAAFVVEGAVKEDEQEDGEYDYERFPRPW